MNVVKRNGDLENFSKTKIRSSIEDAAANSGQKVPKDVSKKISDSIDSYLSSNATIITTADISKLVENKLMSSQYKDVARKYIEYRHDADVIHAMNTTDKDIMELVSGENDEWNTENSNKDAALVTTQRDYIAGIVSKDIAKRYIIPKKIMKAHNKGAIHVHDMDYMLEQTRTNCGLVNLEDMLNNGTVINNVMIEKPHRLLTAMNVATQIIVAVSSSQYGGVSVSLSHIAPFVDSSRKIFTKKYKSVGLDDKTISKLVEIDVKKEVEAAVQTFNYQVNSMSSTNGQAPFITLWMYLGEAKNDSERADLAMLIEEFLKQRIQGMKNKDGAYVTVAFPKLVLCLDKYIMSNEYKDLLKLAAECSSKRLVPDYVSEKMMLEHKIGRLGYGNAYPPMGCLDYNEIIELDTGSIKIGKLVEISKDCKFIESGKSRVYDLTDLGLNIKSGSEFTELRGFVVNYDESNWLNITYKNSCGVVKHVLATYDHPFKSNGSIVLAENLSSGSIIDGVKDKLTVIGIKKLDIVANSYDVTTGNEHFNINGDIYSHNCRSFLTPDRIESNIANATNYDLNKHKYYGRANIGVTSLNLAYIAFEAVDRDKDFFDVLDKYADLAHEMQKIRAKRISETKAKVAPILWCDGAYARLNPEDNLSKLVHNGYMTSSIGYSGLYECAKKVTGCDFWNDKKAHDFAVKVLEHLNSLCNAWKKSENIDYSIYGTPNESGTYKMATAVKRDFGEDAFEKLDGHDRDYITNSCHVPVFEDIDAFSKLGTESEYQLLSPGGNITYIETPDMASNLDAVIEVMKFIYNNVMYSEINCESGYCSSCGRFNTIHLEGERGHYKPVCSACGNDDRSKLNYAVRVCGYISTNEFNSGRAEDVHDRVKHLDNKILKE